MKCMCVSIRRNNRNRLRKVGCTGKERVTAQMISQLMTTILTQGR